MDRFLHSLLVSSLFLVQEFQTQLLLPVSHYFIIVLLQLGPWGGRVLASLLGQGLSLDLL